MNLRPFLARFMNNYGHFLTAAIILTASFAHAQLAKDVTRVPVVFSGGHGTDPQDGGRPVVLIAAALGSSPRSSAKPSVTFAPLAPVEDRPTKKLARTRKCS
jgi:hypothetical protein